MVKWKREDLLVLHSPSPKKYRNVHLFSLPWTRLLVELTTTHMIHKTDHPPTPRTSDNPLGIHFLVRSSLGVPGPIVVSDGRMAGSRHFNRRPSFVSFYFNIIVICLYVELCLMTSAWFVLRTLHDETLFYNNFDVATFV